MLHYFLNNFLDHFLFGFRLLLSKLLLSLLFLFLVARRVVLIHLLDLRQDLLFFQHVVQLFQSFLLSLPLLQVFDLLLQLKFVLVLLRLLSVELVLCDVFESVWGAHVHYLFECRAVGSFALTIHSRSFRRVSARFDASVVLRVVRKLFVLRYHFACLISYRSSPTILVSKSIVCIELLCLGPVQH